MADWYVVQTFSNYEKRVKASIDMIVRNRGLQGQILEVAIPMQEVVEVKNGARKNVMKKMFPGYVFVNMEMNNATWYVIRNTSGVTGFPGSDKRLPAPLNQAEVDRIFSAEKKVEIQYKVDDLVQVTSGPWEGTKGKVGAVNAARQTVTINVNIFGRDTPVDISFMDLKKV